MPAVGRGGKRLVGCGRRGSVGASRIVAPAVILGPRPPAPSRPMAGGLPQMPAAVLVMTVGGRLVSASSARRVDERRVLVLTAGGRLGLRLERPMLETTLGTP